MILWFSEFSQVFPHFSNVSFQFLSINHPLRHLKHESTKKLKKCIRYNDIIVLWEEFLIPPNTDSLIPPNSIPCRSQWPRGLRRKSEAARLLRSWVRIPRRAWRSVCCECCVLSGRGLCDELITRPDKSYRLRCVVVCDLETSWMRSHGPLGGCRAKNKHHIFHCYHVQLLFVTAW
jgi:hypothetical protein